MLNSNQVKFIDIDSRYHAIDFPHKPDVTAPQLASGKYFYPRSYQIKPINGFALNKNSVNIWPTGSGKTFGILSGCCKKFNNGTVDRFIITVPQIDIGQNFLDVGGDSYNDGCWIQLDNVKGKKFNFCPIDLVGSQYDNTGKIKQFLAWVNNKPGCFGDRFLVCTYATLVAGLKELERAGKLGLLDRTALIADEGHHINSSDDEFNQLGYFCQLMEDKKVNFERHVFTATFCRGDKCPILKPEQIENKNIVLVEDYLATTEIEGVKFIAVIADSYEDGIEAIDKKLEDNSKFGIYLPFTPAGGRESVTETLNENIQNILKKNNSKIKLLDFVLEENKKESRSIFKTGKGFNGFTAQNLVQEGWDWVDMDTVIVLGHRESIPQLVQMVGRALRDSGRTKFITVYLVLAYNYKLLDHEESKETFNKYLNAMMAVQCGLDDFIPSKLDKLLKKDKKPVKSKPGAWKIFDDPNKQQKFETDVLKECLNTIDFDPNNLNKLTEDVFEEVVVDVLAKLDQNVTDAKKIAASLWLKWKLKTIRVKYPQASEIDFELLKDVSVIDFALQISSEWNSVGVYKNFRDIWLNTVKTTEEFIQQANITHNYKYDYSKVNYIRAKDKVIIICSSHGEFKQKADGHLRGNGCGRCSGKYKTIEDFIQQASIVHNFKYNYSKSIYITSLEKLTIICPDHGDFNQSPSSHLTGHGCRKCGGVYKLNTDEFIVKANITHNYIYNYSKSKYINTLTKLTIICKIHGEFEQTPAAHLFGQKCPKCRGFNKTTEEFISESNVIHNNKYNYSKANYTTAAEKLIIICDSHGEFIQTARDHLNGQGCAKCYGNVKLTTEEFINRSNIIHHFKYDYSKTEYTGSDNKVIIICKTHGEFKQIAYSHLSGKNCISCAGNKKFNNDEFIEKLYEIYGSKYKYNKIKYKNNNTSVLLCCKKHGWWLANPKNLLNGHGCRKCLYPDFIINGKIYNQTEVAEKFNVSKSAIGKLLKKKSPQEIIQYYTNK